MPSVTVRPEPDRYQAGELAKGKTHIRRGTSGSWFSKGALDTHAIGHLPRHRGDRE